MNIECDEYHYGTNCINECRCGVGADTCDHVTGCQCLNGWLGDYCDTDINECASAPCTGQNEVCVNTPGSFVCDCETGYENVGGLCQGKNPS